MILRIEIYEHVSDEQIAKLKVMLSHMGLEVLTVERFDAEEEEEPPNYEVVVGNVGTVYDGASEEAAHKAFSQFVERSESGLGRCGNEQVTLFKDGDLIDQHDPEPREPDEDDWWTRDYTQWFRYGMMYSRGDCHFTTQPDTWAQEMKQRMEADGWWPNCWYLGERGDWNLLDVQKGCFAKESK